MSWGVTLTAFWGGDDTAIPREEEGKAVMLCQSELAVRQASLPVTLPAYPDASTYVTETAAIGTQATNESSKLNEEMERRRFREEQERAQQTRQSLRQLQQSEAVSHMIDE